MQPPDTRYVRRPDGVSIAYQVFGNGPADLLYAQGWVSHLDLQWMDPGFTSFLRRLGQFARVIAFDKPGTGLSDPMPKLATLEERVEDMVRVLDAAGSDRAVLFGVSEGGPASLLFAALHPDRVEKLILYGSFPSGTPPAERPPELGEDEWRAYAERSRMTREAVEEIVERWGEGRVVDLFAPSVANRLQRRFWGAFERAAASPGMARALMNAVYAIDVSEILPTVAVPALILHRRGDVIPVGNARILAARIPGARLVELDGDDHAFWFGDFEPIVAEMERFVTGGRAHAEPERQLSTVLFTDIVNSTRRAAELGDHRWRAVLEEHDALVRRHVEVAGGRVVKSLGDGSLSLFGGPARAVRCAEELMAALADAGLAVRAGLHTGECEIVGDDVAGLAVHIGARIGALSGAGEILVSSTVADLVVGSGLSFQPRGTHALKGVPGEWRLLAVGSDAGPAAPIAAAHDTMRATDRMAVKLARRAPRAMRAAARLSQRR